MHSEIMELTVAESITIEVRGTPKAQPRPRAFAKKMGNGTYAARVYESGTAEAWKSEIAQAVRAAGLDGAMMAGPIRVDCEFLFDRPKRLLRRKDLEGLVPHTSKPDRDNLDKAVLDCLTTLQVFSDDAQVFDGRVTKWYCLKDRSFIGAVITITRQD